MEAQGYDKLVEALRYYDLNKHAADAIEELQETLEAVQKNSGINFRMWEEAQAEVERLKEGNEELRKRQTYIDRYGNEWLTSAEDVPNYAYEHGYADGRAEAEAQLPKQGKIVRCGECKWYAPLDRKRPFFCPVMDCATGVMEDDFCSRGERRAKMEVHDETEI